MSMANNPKPNSIPLSWLYIFGICLRVACLTLIFGKYPDNIQDVDLSFLMFWNILSRFVFYLSV